MEDRLNLGSDVRELKLGSSFNGNNSRTSTSFHTLKYDFKPTSLDLSKVATVDCSSNNQVTVSVPHLDTSGVPKTVFKGNQRSYTKECVLIIDKVTGEITLEKLNTNIQVKKTRSENTNKVISPQPSMLPQRASLENSTQRTVSKTKVSTGVRKNAIGSFVQRHSPIQGSPSYQHHKSPQQAPAWNANNTQSTLPSIPMIELDDIPIVPQNSSSTTLPVTATEQSSYQQPQQLYQPPNLYQQTHHHSAQSTGMNSFQSNIIGN
ncbi:Ell-associated factor Eaf, partial [Pseudolycoriella hygida]